MGGVAKAAANVGTFGLAGMAERSGDAAKSDWQSQFDAMGPGARPDLVARQSRLGDDGLLKDVYKLKGSDAYKTAALDQQKNEEADLGSKAASQAAGAGAMARSSLASRGGLTGGAAERLAKGQMQGQIGAVQDAARQGVANRGAIGLNAADRSEQENQFNIQQALNEKNAQDQYNMGKYQQDMQAWAAAKQGQATFGAGKGKGQSGGIMGGVSKIAGK